MNVEAAQEKLHVSGFNRDLRFDRDDEYSISKSNHSNVPLHSSFESHGSGSPVSGYSPVGGSRTGYHVNIHHLKQSNNYNKNGAIEVDFYKNPTVLSRMILFQKYANANKRCRDHPEEASVWVCAKRKSNVTQSISPFHGMFEKSRRRTSAQRGGGLTPRHPQSQQQPGYVHDENEYSLRQLPIHIACTSLAFSHDPVSRKELELLIVRLVVTYPDGCSEFDHGGKLPLHEAIWSNATPETTAMLLMASPASIDQRDKFGRTPMELNNRRSGGNKSEIRDMLNLGVPYWDHARQEAKLRLKSATIRPCDKSIASTSVMNTSQATIETLNTTASVNYDSAPLPKDLATTRKPRIEIKSEEITPTAWGQLERRVILLEQLLAEMCEKNYELSGVVEKLKKAKKELLGELEAARAAASAGPIQPTPIQRVHSTGGAGTPSSKTSSGAAVHRRPIPVPEDDEISSGSKLAEHTERIAELESLVESYHDTKRKKRFAGSSRVSELSSFSSGTHDGVFAQAPDEPDLQHQPRHRGHLVRSDSLVSGLTQSDTSFFDTSVHAVRQAWLSSQDEDEDTTINYDDEEGPFGTSSGNKNRITQVVEELDTDNLSDMFHKVAEIYGSANRINHDTTPTGPISTPKSNRGWDTPVAIASSAPTDTPPAWESTMSVEEEGESPSSSSSSETLVSESKEPYVHAQPPADTSGGEIYFPGFMMDPQPAHVNSTISLSASSASHSSRSSRSNMSENSTIVSDENEIYFVGGRGETAAAAAAAAPGLPPASSSFEEESTTFTGMDESTIETLSTRGRIENIVFGPRRASGRDGEGQQPRPPRTTATNTTPSAAAAAAAQQLEQLEEEINQDSSRFNFDIEIPALDTYYSTDDMGEI
jgi:hypothetical protein